MMIDCNNCAFLKFEKDYPFGDWSCEKGHDPVCVMRGFLKYCPDYENKGKYWARLSLDEMRKECVKKLKEKQV